MRNYWGIFDVWRRVTDLTSKGNLKSDKDDVKKQAVAFQKLLSEYNSLLKQSIYNIVGKITDQMHREHSGRNLRGILPRHHRDRELREHC